MLRGAPSFLTPPAARGGRLLVARAQRASRRGAAALALVLVSCGSDTAPPPGDRAVTVRDSAGVTIVENHAPDLPEPATWRLSGPPTLQIGSIDDPDELFVGLRRISLFESDGSFVTVLRPQPPEPGGGFSFFARFDDGSYMTQGGTNPMYLGEGDGLIRGAGWITRLGPDGASLGNILEFRTGESVVAAGGRASMGTPLGRRHIAVAGREGPVVGFADGFRFEMYDWEGTLLRRVSRAWEPVPVTGR